MSVGDIAAKRWERDEDPSKHKPREALLAALRYLDDPEQPEVEHAIVLFGRIGEDRGAVTRHYQAGSFDGFAQQGLIYQALDLLFRED